MGAPSLVWASDQRHNMGKKKRSFFFSFTIVKKKVLFFHDREEKKKKKTIVFLFFTIVKKKRRIIFCVTKYQPFCFRLANSATDSEIMRDDFCNRLTNHVI